MLNKKATIIKSVILALLGLIFIIFPDIVGKYIIYLIGGLIISFGIINLITSIKTDNKATRNFGIYIAIFGIIVILLSDFILSVIGICIGLFCLFSGISSIGISLKMKDMQQPYIVLFIKGAISLIISVLLFVLPKIYIHVQIIIIGIYLLVNSANNLYKGLTTKQDNFDFFNFHFNNEDNNELNNNDSIIDVESSIVDKDE